MVKAEILSRFEPLGPRTNVGLGDLASLPPDIRTQIINSVASMAFEKRTAMDELRIQTEAQKLRAELIEFKSYVRNPNNYPPQASETIRRLYLEADNRNLGNNMETRVGTRLVAFERPHIVMDYDNTITDHNKPLEKLSGFTSADPNDQLITLIPLSAIGEPLLKKIGRDNFAEAYATTWQFLLRDEKGRQAFRLNGENAPIREGVGRFLAYAKKDMHAELTVVSANFEPFVMGGLDKIPEAEGINVFAVRENSIIPTAKGDLLAHLAQRDPKKALIYIGDGASDLPTLQAQDLVACYFALEGTEFENALKEEKLPHFAYRDFNDVTMKLEQINKMRNKIAT